MYQRILVPFDGSPTSRRGLDEAIELATLTNGRLRLVHMVDDLLYVTGFESCSVRAPETSAVAAEVEVEKFLGRA